MPVIIKVKYLTEVSKLITLISFIFSTENVWSAKNGDYKNNELIRVYWINV